MADQIPRIKPKRLVLLLKPPRLCFQTLTVGLCILAAIICSVLTSTCPPSVPSSAATTIEQYSFSQSASSQTDGLAVGLVSNSLYYLHDLSSSNSAAVRKVDASGSQTWIASFAFQPIRKSLSVDAAEQSVYLASQTSTLVALKLLASNGSVVSQHKL